MSGLHHKLRFAACLILVTLVSGAIAWLRAFSTIAPYDDEGTLMLSVRRFLDGRILYDSLLSIYGPLYYAYESLAHSLTGMPVSHDSVRLVSATFWVAASMAVFLLVYRVTGSLAAALAAHYTGFRALGFIGREPAHPQEMCILLLLGVGLAASVRRPLCMAWFGALAGAIALTKINLGVLVVAALVVVLGFALPRRGIRRVLLPAAAVGGVAIPFLLMAAHIAQPWAMRYALLIALSLVAAILAVAGNKMEPLSIRDVAIAALSGLVCAALIASFVLAHGSTVPGMIYSLVIWPRSNFAQSVIAPMEVGPAPLLWAAACLFAAWLVSRNSMPDGGVMVLKLVFGVVVTVFAGTPNYQNLLCAGTPLVWLVAVDPNPSTASPSSMLRPVLAVLGVLQVLNAYPMAGSHMAFAAVIIIAIAAICVWDTLPGLAARLERVRHPISGRIAAAGIVSLVMVMYGVSLWGAVRRFQSQEPLALPGAQHVRVDPGLAVALRRLSLAARPCSMLVTEPGLFSLNLFSGAPAPSDLRSTPWMLLMSEPDQAIAVRELEAQPRPCVVYNAAIEKIWTHGEEPPQRSLVLYLRDNFRTEFEVGGYRFMVRK